MRIVYTGGTFDLFHIGHIELLEYCASLGDKVIVSLNKDDFVKRYKGEYPMIPYNERKEMLLSTKYVDEVISNIGGENSRMAILNSGANIIVIGMDWLEKDYCKQMGFTPEWLSTQEIILCYVPRTKNISTTLLKQKFKEAGRRRADERR